MDSVKAGFSFHVKYIWWIWKKFLYLQNASQIAEGHFLSQMGAALGLLFDNCLGRFGNGEI